MPHNKFFAPSQYDFLIIFKLLLFTTRLNSLSLFYVEVLKIAVLNSVSKKGSTEINLICFFNIYIRNVTYLGFPNLGHVYNTSKAFLFLMNKKI